MNSSQHDRRRFFRIDDSMSLSYREVPPDTLGQLVERLERGIDNQFTVVSSLAAISQEMTGMLHKIEASHRDIAVYLKSLDKKINILGQALLGQTPELFDQPIRQVNLSAAGISFGVDEVLQPGTTLELKLLLMPNYTGILCYAEVVGCDAIDKLENDAGYCLRAAFSHIREEDRDVLIQHVIQRQSVQLRKARRERELER